MTDSIAIKQTNNSNQSSSLEQAVNFGLKPEEYDKIKSLIKRIPNLVELGIFSAMWSEHCSYKSSRKHLAKLPSTGDKVVHGPGENAGVIDIGDGLVAVFKIESHNHPSFIEPFQGAATGVGGIMRDVFTMGARPVANLNILHFGEIDHPKTMHLLKGVVSGISFYGNCMGVPTIGGNTNFNKSYNKNILVNAMTVGIAPKDKIFLSAAKEIGFPVIYVGSASGKDGIHGASMASAEFDDDSVKKRPTVQVGDPFMEKLLLEACLELMQDYHIIAIQDMGAAGLTSSAVEMASKASNHKDPISGEFFTGGMKLNLDKVPTREKNMSALEIMLSESQERMLIILKPESQNKAQEIFAKWDVPFAIIGETTNNGNLEIEYNNNEVVNLPVDILTNHAPLYDRPHEKLVEKQSPNQDHFVKVIHNIWKIKAQDKQIKSIISVLNQKIPYLFKKPKNSLLKEHIDFYETKDYIEINLYQSNELRSNKSQSNELPSNKSQSNELPSNKSQSNELPSNKSQSHTKPQVNEQQVAEQQVDTLKNKEDKLCCCSNPEKTSVASQTDKTQSDIQNNQQTKTNPQQKEQDTQLQNDQTQLINDQTNDKNALNNNQQEIKTKTKTTNASQQYNKTLFNSFIFQNINKLFSNAKFTKLYKNISFTANHHTINISQQPSTDTILSSLAKLLTTPELTAKSWITSQYDHSVMANTITNKYSSSALLKITKSKKALAISSNVNPNFCYADPVNGGKQIICESFRLLSASGADPIAYTNCLNFGNPEKPEIMTQLVGVIDGMAQASKFLDYPVVSGNVSLYNETDGKAILPTPTIGGVGVVAEQAAIGRFDLACHGDIIIGLGETKGNLANSAYLRLLYDIEDDHIPPIDLLAEKRTSILVRQLLAKRLISCVRAVTKGGFMIAIAKTLMASNCGAILTSPIAKRKAAFWFGEDQARYIICVNPKQQNDIIIQASQNGVNAMRLGRIQESEIILDDCDYLNTNMLSNLYQNTLPHKIYKKRYQMPIKQQKLHTLLKASFPDAEIKITDLAGDENHYNVNIKSAAFKQKSKIQQHKLVYASLGDIVGGKLHALSLNTSEK